MKKIFTLTTLAGVLFSLNCMGQQANQPGPKPGLPVISYKIPSNFIVGTTIDPINPSTDKGGKPASYAISPQLPASLNFNTQTGAITGTPNAVLLTTHYIITATNETGNGNVGIDITVLASPPTISYDQVSTFIVGVPIYANNTDSIGKSSTYYIKKNNKEKRDSINQATASRKQKQEIANIYWRSGFPIPNLKPVLNPSTGNDPISYSINPALPTGLVLNPKTGEITGSAMAITANAKYTITANYKTASPSTYDINIAVIANRDVPALPATIEFVGQGDIQQSLSSGAKIPANTGIGVIYRENSNSHYGILHNIEVEFSVNVASTVDTVKATKDASFNVSNKSAFGNSVLLPLNSGQAFSFGFTGYLTDKGGPYGNYYRNDAAKPLWGFLSGFKVNIAGSNRNWESDSTTTNPDKSTTTIPTLVKASLLSTYVGVFYEFITPTADNNFGQNASVTLGAGYTGRWILGDVEQNAQTILRQRLLGSNVNSFNGVEFQLGLRFYNIKAEVHIPILFSKANIPGLTGVQPTTFIGFSGGFPIDLTKKQTSTP
ncbi:MAG TPA: putative Ig domain-containing protein [Mucilaginibacter sp.]|jgi:hypothetical protein|nr:putative Ig domain-containing protein [Mucilaginibacter sp.]